MECLYVGIRRNTKLAQPHFGSWEVPHPWFSILSKLVFLSYSSKYTVGVKRQTLDCNSGFEENKTPVSNNTVNQPFLIYLAVTLKWKQSRTTSFTIKQELSRTLVFCPIHALVFLWIR